MSTATKYAIPTDVTTTWDVPTTAAARFNWEYDDGRDRLLALYQKGKDKQWDATKRIDWSIDVDWANPLGFPDNYNPFTGTEIWEKMSKEEQDNFTHHQAAWTWSQFLHGEQGAMITAARIVETVPDLDSKFYGSTQTMDEARHVEVFSRFLQEKIGTVFPMNKDLAALLNDALTASEWDYAYLGMQVLIEGLALAAFGLSRDLAENPLGKQLLAYVMQDEARHVAFGRLALRDAYAELSEKERSEREDFVVEGCWLMRNRFLGTEVYEALDMPVEECTEIAEHSEFQQMFRSLLFSRIVPCVKDIGLWGEKVQKCYAEMGVLDMAGVNLEQLMKADEDQAELIDRQKAEEAARIAEVEATIAVGAEA
ncbi:MAG TPA: ferritin-like domain-containing protein [Mycobacteriales bacterium]|nr:ferritin-like domain-containing protein [Mycobacteriales bacterium]